MRLNEDMPEDGSDSRNAGAVPEPVGGSFFGITDPEFIRKLQRDPGAHDVWETLYTRYELPIRRRVEAMVRGDRRLADEITHTFLSDPQQVGYLRNYNPTHGRFRHYVSACVRNYVRRFLATREAEGAGDPEAVERIPSVDEPGLEMEEERAWAEAILRNALERLGTRRRELLVARYGLFGRPLVSAEDIMASRGITRSDLDTSLFRARKVLRGYIEIEIRRLASLEADFDRERTIIFHRLRSAFSGLVEG